MNTFGGQDFNHFLFFARNLFPDRDGWFPLLATPAYYILILADTRSIAFTKAAVRIGTLYFLLFPRLH